MYGIDNVNKDPNKVPETNEKVLFSILNLFVIFMNIRYNKNAVKHIRGISKKEI